MNGFDSPAAIWLLIFVLLLGVLIAWAARLSEGSAYQAVTQAIFYMALPLVGLITAFALTVGPGCWLTCATTFSVMVLTVTCDFRGSREAATW
jgi:hypothetical protein